MSSKTKVDTVGTKQLLGRLKGNLKMGLVGLPNVGKSTTFNFLAAQTVPAENFPFCTLDPHEAIMEVPDERFKWLCKHFKPKSEVPASITIYDIAGLVPGAHKGEGLGNAFLANIQAVDGIFHVVRAFDDIDIAHTEGDVDPIRDLQIIHEELLYKDLERLDKIHETMQKTRAHTDLATKAKFESVVKIHEHVKNKMWITQGNWKAHEIQVLNEYMFLTAKPVVYLVNLTVKDFARQKNKWLAKIATWTQENNPGIIVPFCADFESQLCALADEEAKQSYLKSVGVSKSMLPKIISTGYKCLDLIHYFTCGPDEVKCWTIRQGTKAPQAARVIHTDFEKGFICAEIAKYADLVEYGSEAAAKSAGKLYQKGKDYVVEDGDIIFFKFNVSHGGSKK